MNEKSKLIAVMAANVFPDNAFYLDKQLQNSIDQSVRIANQIYAAVEAQEKPEPAKTKKAEANEQPQSK